MESLHIQKKLLLPGRPAIIEKAGAQAPSLRPTRFFIAAEGGCAPHLL
jgi:hypothetical protein